VVLVHGAFADASGFAGVIRELESAGHTALAPPNPLRGGAFDASVVSDVVKAIDGPVVLVGHSYGGAVIGQASAGLENVTGLGFLAAFGPHAGQSRACRPGRSPRPATTRRGPRAVPTCPSSRSGSGRRSAPTCRWTWPMSCSRPSARSRSRRSTRTPPRRAGRASRPGSWSPSTTTRSRRTRNGSWRSGWAPRAPPLTARTPRSSPSRSPWPRSSARRCGDLVDRVAVLALRGERAAVSVLVALAQPQAGQPGHQVQGCLSHRL